MESIYKSVCVRKLTNRGFAKSPFCPIYGFGFVGAYFILQPVSQNTITLFIGGVIIGTSFEYFVGELMIKIFGDFWWDYSKKPFNYKGIICLESTCAWGLYALCLFGFLQEFISAFSDYVDPTFGRYFCGTAIIIYLLDFSVQFMRALNINLSERFHKLRESYHNFREKF